MRSNKILSYFRVLLLAVFFLFLTGCHTAKDNTVSVSSGTPTIELESTTSSQEDTLSSEVSLEEHWESEVSAMKIQISFGEFTFTAIPASNPSAQAFLALLKDGPVTVQMRDYANMEKVGALGTDLPRSDKTITTQPGDIILYQGNQITIYYDTNTWSFTKLAQIENTTGEELYQALGSGDVEVTFSLLS
jgi:hypothetical protein